MNSLHKLCLGSMFVLALETFQINLLWILRTPPSEGPARRSAGKHALKLKTFRDGWQVRQVPMTHLDIPQLIKDRRTGLLSYYYIRPHGRWCDLRSVQWESFLAEYLCDWMFTAEIYRSYCISHDLSLLAASMFLSKNYPLAPHLHLVLAHDFSTVPA